MFARLREWLLLADYEAAKDHATDVIIARYARGNTSIQNGWYLDETDLAALSRAGDDALLKLKRLIPARYH
jgi:hypothetical protein